MNFTLPKTFSALVVLGHSNEDNIDGDNLTFDCEIRTRAAGILYQEKKAQNIYLTGGGNDTAAKIPETQKMSKYLQANYKIPVGAIIIDPSGTNTLGDISNFLLQNKDTQDDTVAYLTSDYNVNRLKLILEIFGKPDSFVLSAEHILLFATDSLSEKIKEYLNSVEYQDRLKYESYWIAKTITDSTYTKNERERLEIYFTPQEYFSNQPKRLMKNLEENI